MQCYRPPLRRAALLIAAMAISTAVTGRAHADNGSQTFANPTHNSYRVDYCANWGQGCGEQAATQFCKLKGFDKAGSWAIAENIGAAEPTLVIGDNKVCDQASCDGFASITCLKSATASQPPSLDAASRLRAPALSPGPGDPKAHKLTLPPMPGLEGEIWFVSDHPKLHVSVSAASLWDGALRLDWQKKPMVQGRFQAKANTAYTFECMTEALKAFVSLGYTLEWSRNIGNKEKVEFGPSAETMPFEQNHPWIRAVIPKYGADSWITVRASGFTSSKNLLMCRLMSFK